MEDGAALVGAEAAAPAVAQVKQHIIGEVAVVVAAIFYDGF